MYLDNQVITVDKTFSSVYLFNFSEPLLASSMSSRTCIPSCGGSPYVATSHTNTP